MATGRKNDNRKRPTNRPVKKINPSPKGNANRFYADDRKKSKNKRNRISLADRFKVQKKYSQVDFVFIFLVFLLLAFGFVALLSVSPDASRKLEGNSYNFIKTQMLGIGLGIVAMLIFTYVDYQIYKKAVPFFFVLVGVMLIMCRVPFLGKKINGAWRWLRYPFLFQPSELMKPLMAMFIAWMITSGRRRLDTFKGLLPYLIVMVVIGGIIFGLQSHASGAIIICSICVMLTVVAGTKLKYYIIMVLGISPLVGLYLMVDKMRLGRILTVFDPFRDTTDRSYQVIQSLVSICSGGLFGKGLGQGMQKYGYLPEGYNDFIFALVCEELGMVGAIIIMALFAAFIIRGLKIAFEAPDAYGMLTVVGIMTHIALQTVLNMGVVCSLVPNTGIALPFFSYGGTAIMVLLAEMGVIMNVSRQSVKLKGVLD